LEEFFRPLEVFERLSWESARAAFDIVIVWFAVYRLLALIRGTRAWRIVGGIVVFMLFLVGSQAAGFTTIHWLLDKATLLGPVALVILLLPEMRRAIEGIGQIGLWPQRFANNEVLAEASTVEELVAACAELASTRTGALVVIEKGSPLEEIVANGVLIDSRVTAPLLGSIFYGTNPLHDGAVVIRGDRVVAAACRLPLSDRPGLDPRMHMRHRAAVGVVEQMDCLAIVVSEERGTIGFAIDGTLEIVDSQQLREKLNRYLRGIEATKTRERKLVFGRSAKEKEAETRVS
jgi:diadenylate cyclase